VRLKGIKIKFAHYNMFLMADNSSAIIFIFAKNMLEKDIS